MPHYKLLTEKDSENPTRATKRISTFLIFTANGFWQVLTLEQNLRQKWLRCFIIQTTFQPQADVGVAQTDKHVLSTLGNTILTETTK